MSVLAAGKGGEIDVEDLGLKKSFSLATAALAAPTYNDLMLEVFFFFLNVIILLIKTLLMQSYATLHPKLSFVHTYPGFVRTPLASSSTSPLLSLASPLITGLTYVFSHSAEECGEYMWYGLLAAKDGFTRMGEKGQDIGMKRYFGNEEQRKKLWEHTKETTRVKDDTD